MCLGNSLRNHASANLRPCLCLLLLALEVIEVRFPGLLHLPFLPLHLLLQGVHVHLVPSGIVVLHGRLVPRIRIGLVLWHLPLFRRLLGCKVRPRHNGLLAPHGCGHLRQVVPDAVLLGVPERVICLLDGRLPVQKVLHGLVDLILRRYPWVEHIVVLWGHLQQLLLAGFQQVREVAAVVLDQLDVPLEDMLVAALLDLVKINVLQLDLLEVCPGCRVGPTACRSH
mmetsp:Transcript_58442/g.161713  ORF Transcript_58442/g.161713 Transcript_58442/m.161713 type:complete len:226 (-) Transcript_58442:8-685(-)